MGTYSMVRVFKILLSAILATLVVGCNPLAPSSSNGQSVISSSQFQPGLPAANDPVASNASLSLYENLPTQGTLTATNPNNGTLTYTIVSQASHGSAVLTHATSGAFTYTPVSNYSGSDSFTFKANDGFVDSNTATISFSPRSALYSIAWKLAPGASGTPLKLTPFVSFQILLQDINSNTLTGDSSTTVTLSLTSGTGALGGTTTQTAVNGIVTFNNITYSKAETITLKATENSSGNHYSVSQSLTINPVHFVLSTISSPLTKGSAFSLTVTVKEGSNNTVSGYVGSVSLSSTDTSATLASSHTFTGSGGDAGAYTFTGLAFSTTGTQTITSTNGAVSTSSNSVTVIPALSMPSSLLYPLGDSSPPGTQGTAISLSATSLASGTTNFSCTYETVGLSSSDPNYAAPGGNTSCSSLPTIGVGITNSAKYTTTGAFTNSSGTGSATATLSWTPTPTQRGTYKFILKVTDGNAQTNTGNVYVTIMDNTTSTSLLTLLDAQFADVGAASALSSTPAQPRLTANSDNNITGLFKTLTGSFTGDLSSFSTASPYQGTGQTSTVSPYALSFNGTSDKMKLSSVLNGQSSFGMQTWVKPTTPATAGAVIAGNGGGIGNGMTLRQSTTPTGRAEFVVGQKYYSYRDIVLSDAPIVYWRLDETSGITAQDLSSSAISGTYSPNAAGSWTGGTLSTSNTGALTGSQDPDYAALFNGSTGSITISSASAATLQIAYPVSVELWAKPASTAAGTLITSDPGLGYSMSWSSSRFNFGVKAGGSYSQFSSPSTYAINQWHHLVLVYDGSFINGYVDGTQVVHQAETGALSYGNTTYYCLGEYCDGGFSSGWYSGLIDEYAVYSSALSTAEILNHYNSGTYHNNPTYNVPYPGNAVLADKPSLYWRLDEKTGTTANDFSGNGNIGTYSGTYTMATTGLITNSGDQDAAFYLGSSGSITSSYTTPNSNFTVELWAQLSSSSGAWSTPLGDNGGPAGWNLQRNNTGNTIDVRIDTSAATNQTSGFAPVVYDGNTHHIVIVFFNGTYMTYIDGSPQGLITYNPGTGLGAAAGNTGHFSSSCWRCGQGNSAPQYITYDEIAVYPYPLSQTQVLNHYNSGNGPGWWFCQSQTQLNSSNWNFLSTLWDGTKAKMYVNGQQECSVQPATVDSAIIYSSTAANTFVGADSAGANFWGGVLSWLGISSSGTSTAQSDFTATANRFRTTPVENIVTSGLVLNVDAANAYQGTQPYTPAGTCTSAQQVWYDLSPFSNNGTLQNFSGCGASSGWNGNGTTSPYTLNFLTGSLNYVSFPYISQYDPNSGNLTVAAWVKSSTSCTGNHVYVGHYLSLAANWWLGCAPTGTGQGTFSVSDSNTISATASSTATLINDGKWHYLTGVKNGNSLTVYVDAGSPATSTASYTGNFTSTHSVQIGAFGTSYYPTASVAIVQIYSSALSLAQIKQNCLAQEPRFTATPYPSGSNICGVP